MAKNKKTEPAPTQEAPSARNLLDSSLIVIERELKKLANISAKGEAIPLDMDDMHALLSITRALVAVDKNEQDYPEEEDPFMNLSDEELQAEARKILAEKKK